MSTLNLPKHILDEIITLHAEGQNSLIISKIVEQKYGEELSKLHINLPSYSQLDKFIKATATKVVPLTETHYFTENNINLEEDVGKHKLSSYDTVLGKQIRLGSVKDTNTDLKNRIAATIARMENQRVNYPETFTDKDEDRLQRYYDILSKHNLSELKVADALKDKDVLDTQTVVFFINKLFSSIKTCVDKYMSENKDRFFLDLKQLLSINEDTSIKTLTTKIDQLK